MKLALAPITAAAAMLGGCATAGHADRPGTCRPAAAAKLVGQAAPDDTELLRRTGSTIIRRLAPGDMATRDYRIERLTLTVDGGRIVAAACN